MSMQNAHGVGDKCYIIAEIGLNHDGDILRALSLVDRAVWAGADCVKFQAIVGLGQFPEYCLPWEQLEAVKDYATNEGIAWLCTPFSPEDAKWLRTVDDRCKV